jgi:hypothetical protein
MGEIHHYDFYYMLFQSFKTIIGLPAVVGQMAVRC